MQHETLGNLSHLSQRNDRPLRAPSRADRSPRGNVGTSQLDTAAIVTSYTSLHHVERALRSIETLDLHVRSIHHRSEKRVRTHVLLCMLACYVQRPMRRA